MSIFLKIISLITIVAAIAVPAAINQKRYDMADRFGNGSYKKVDKRYTLVPVVAAIVLFVVSSAFVIIPTGYTGVRSTFGQINESVVQNGFNWKIPFVQSIEKVNNKQQDISFKDRVWSETSERTAIYYEGITVTYQINPERSAWIYANVTNYKDALVSQNLVASAIKASSKSLSDTDATNRSIIEPLAQENIQISLDEKYGTGVVYVNKVTISGADFEDSYNAAIAAKQQAQLNAEQQAIENQRAIDKATADAQAMRTNAEAEAQAKLIAAEAEAQANELLEKSLTEMILRQMYINKWNGQLPNVMTGDDSTSIMVPSGSSVLG